MQHYSYKKILKNETITSYICELDKSLLLIWDFIDILILLWTSKLLGNERRACAMYLLHNYDLLREKSAFLKRK